MKEGISIDVGAVLNSVVDKRRLRVIVVGPQGSGKSVVALWLSRALAMSHVVDPWDGVEPLPAGFIAATNVSQLEVDDCTVVVSTTVATADASEPPSDVPSQSEGAS